jgi:sugar phosphate isomerase/epimerase
MVDPGVFFEVDTYWAQTGGVEAADLVRKLGAKAPLLHIKDGPCVKGEPMTAVGDGVMDVGAIVNAGKPYTEWMIVELDACATDIIEAVAKSYSYLVGKGFAHGTKKT